MLLLCRSCRAVRSNDCFILQRRRLTSSHKLQKVKTPRARVPATAARTRFAPSPTGYLHLGSLRTALFNYLLAKKTGGQFLLRVEDTDESRTVPDAEEKLYRDLRWAGLDWDEGPDIGGPLGPYKQSQRTKLYQEHSHKLIETGHAYRCFCSASRLNELAKRRQELGLPTDYDRTCASIPTTESDERAAHGEAHVVRLRAPELYPELNDLVYGMVGKNKGGINAGIVSKHGEIAYEDPILLKSDGRPTYHLANVVDDHFMEITHVVRATEWISSTPKHLALYDAFGWTAPEFAHVGLLVDEQGNKLSKRNHAVNVAAYKDMGVLPEALLNFVSLLGWSHSQRSDVMSLNQLVEQFQMKLTKGNNTVSFEKLWYLQKHHAALAIQKNGTRFDEMVHQILTYVTEAGLNATGEAFHNILGPRSLRDYIAAVLNADPKAYATPKAFVIRNIHFFQRPTASYTPDPEFEISAESLVAEALSYLESISYEEWREDLIAQKTSEFITRTAQQLQSKDHRSETPSAAEQMSEGSWAKKVNTKFHHDMRMILQGTSTGPKLALIMATLGREETLWRLSRHLNTKDAAGTGLDQV